MNFSTFVNTSTNKTHHLLHMLHITTVAGSCIPQYLHAWSGNSLLLYNASSSSSNCNSAIALVTLDTLDERSARPNPFT